jgi:1-acyl-sn-glycerol-3-phosphate acyltransferase
MKKIIRPIIIIFVLTISLVLAIIFRIFLPFYDWILIRYWAKTIAFIYGIKIITLNKTKDTPAIIVTNHISYWDIILLGARYKAFFVSKASVKDWPLIGWGARFTRTVFIERKNARNAKKVLDEKANKIIKTKNSLLMFPEGTTTNNPCGPFKMGAFKLAFNTNTPIKPLATYYNKIKQMAWIGDNKFTPHLLKVGNFTNIKYYIYEMPLLYPKDFTSAKEMKEKCQKMIQEKIKHIKGFI